MSQPVLIAISGAVGTIFSGFLLFVLRSPIEQWLKRKTEKDIERYRSDLATEVEIAKQDLQKDALRFQLSMSRLHEIYPAIYEALKYAEGAVGRLTGMSMYQDIGPLTDDEAKQRVDELQVDRNSKSEILALLKSNAGEAQRRYVKAVRTTQLIEARTAKVKAHNLILKKALFMSEELREECLQVSTGLEHALIELEIAEDPVAAAAKLEEVSEAIRFIENTMRSELRPAHPAAERARRETQRNS